MKQASFFPRNDLMDSQLLTAPDYPIRFDYDSLDPGAAVDPNWLWHPDLEFNLVLEGQIEFFVEDERITLSQGQAIFKNANVLHYTREATGQDPARLLSILMSTEFIAPAHSRMYQRYVEPFISADRLRCLPFTGETGWQRDILNLLRQAEAAQAARFGAYELRVHEAMCGIWRILAEHRQSIPARYLSPLALTNQVRIRQMLTRIHRDFGEKLTLADIASAANVSENTCRTCFRAVLRQTPMEYLTAYRLHQAARLLRSTELTVEEIAAQCGFGDSSYFGRLFRRHMGVTPMEYRKNGTGS